MGRLMTSLIKSLNEELLEKKLNIFLEVDLPVLATQEASYFDDFATSKNQGVVIYGCGKLGQIICQRLKKAGLSPSALVDADPSKLGKEFSGLRVLSPADAISQYGKSHVFVVTVWRNFSETKDHLMASGARRVSPFLPFLWKHSEHLLPYYNLDLPSRMLSQKHRIHEAFDLFKDINSKNEFLFQLRWMLSLSADEIPSCSPLKEQYFPQDIFILGSSEILIDGGAFDGDTIREFLDHTQREFGGIAAFEPDPANMHRLETFVASLPSHERSKIQLYSSGLGAKPEVLDFDAAGSEGSALSRSGSTKIEVVALDDILKNISPTYIKMDIEGAEEDALKGSAALISRSHPKLSVCTYHRQDHLWTIPLGIRNIRNDYLFFLRRYRDEFGDVVCYAI